MTRKELALDCIKNFKENFARLQVYVKDKETDNKIHKLFGDYYGRRAHDYGEMVCKILEKYVNDKES